MEKLQILDNIILSMGIYKLKNSKIFYLYKRILNNNLPNVYSCQTTTKAKLEIVKRNMLILFKKNQAHL